MFLHTAMTGHESKPATCSESPILRSLAAAKPVDGDFLQNAIEAVRRHKKDVHVPGYAPFGSQNWRPVFEVGGPMPPTCKDQEGSPAEEQRVESALSAQEVEDLLSPPASFYQGHFSKELPSILHAIGCTPLICLSRVAATAGVACQLLGKCEYLSAGGSTKDRIAYAMVRLAEVTGELAEGAALIEATSGNTGIGLALVSSIKGYRSVAVMPMKMSAEKQAAMHALGATILRTPTKAAWNDQTSHIALSIRLQKEMEESREQKSQDTSHAKVACILDQYRNPANPWTHFFGTGAELLHQAAGQLDMVVICAGTGGTFTGVGRRVKAALPDCLVVGVDPVGSVLADPSEPPGKPYFVEGIGYDFVPTVLDRGVADFWVKVSDAESLLCSRLLIKHEGLLVGGSAGAALAGAFKAIEKMHWTQDPDKRIAVVLPDGCRNYMTKFVRDEWMADKGFLAPELLTRQYPLLKDLVVSSLPLQRLQFIAAAASIREASCLLLECRQSVLCVVTSECVEEATRRGMAPPDAVVGAVYKKNLLAAYGEMCCSTSIEEVAETEVPVFDEETPLWRVAQSLELRPFVFVSTGGLVHAAVGEDLLLQAIVSKPKHGDCEKSESKRTDLQA